MRVKDNVCSWGARWLSVGTVLTVLCQFPSVGAADVLWSWSFSTESGTFVTSGTLAETAGAAVFTFESFSVSASQISGNVGASYNEGSQPIQTMSWDGSQPTQFTRAGGMYTNGSNFYRGDDAYRYTLGAGPTIGILLDSDEHTATDGSLTIVPLGALRPCVGDCDDNRHVTVDEILTMVNIALGNAEISECEPGDANSDGRITVDEILTAVNHALTGCEQQAPELVGTWDSVSLVVDGTSTDCPGEIEVTATISVACFTDALTFNADNSFVRTTTTDEYGDPYDWREEGTWSVEGTLLTITTTRKGPDADHLEPVNPPTQEVGTWSLSGDTLTVSVHLEDLNIDVTGTFQKR